MIGVGNKSCGTWAKDKTAYDNATQPSQLFNYVEETNWVDGFSTAFNNYVWKGKDVGSETDPNGSFAWITNYCAANPTKNIADATDALVTFLSAGPHPNDK